MQPNWKLILLNCFFNSFAIEITVSPIYGKKNQDREINYYNIKYVSMDSLQDELHKYKYGFIIRDNHVVNKVATPTKMNSYLSNYLIPIFSDTVYDFNKYINLGKYTLKIKYPFDAQAIAREIIDFENKIHNYDEYKEIVKDVFRNHYNDDMYIGIISNMIGQLFNIKWLSVNANYDSTNIVR